MIKDFKNSNGTYNGVKLLSELSGLSEQEILWTWNRMKHLRQIEKKTSEEARAIIKEEVKSKPWLEV